MVTRARRKCNHDLPDPSTIPGIGRHGCPVRAWVRGCPTVGPREKAPCEPSRIVGTQRRGQRRRGRYAVPLLRLPAFPGAGMTGADPSPPPAVDQTGDANGPAAPRMPCRAERMGQRAHASHGEEERHGSCDHWSSLGAPIGGPATAGARRPPRGGWEGSRVIYRQRTTIIDDFLLRMVFPWLSAVHATPLLRLARFWTVPLKPMPPTTPGPALPRPVERLWSKIGG